MLLSPGLPFEEISDIVPVTVKPFNNNTLRFYNSNNENQNFHHTRGILLTEVTTGKAIIAAQHQENTALNSQKKKKTLKKC